MALALGFKVPRLKEVQFKACTYIEIQQDLNFTYNQSIINMIVHQTFTVGHRIEIFTTYDALGPKLDGRNEPPCVLLIRAWVDFNHLYQEG